MRTLELTWVRSPAIGTLKSDQAEQKIKAHERRKEQRWLDEKIQLLGRYVGNLMLLGSQIQDTKQVEDSVTRSGDLLDFGQLLNAFGNT